MGDLAASVYAGVRPPGTGHGQRLRQAQYDPQGLLERALHGPETFLTGPPVKGRSVVPKINPPAHTPI
ncbi:hypothetical protein GCM10009742_31600 [Kribbella karoonensis]|uniref:Uncharacterized protein n=1 Tax=Kribbella karoonensis TaxID=324851 RepID=A0ABN2DRE4_9ACTN